MNYKIGLSYCEDYDILEVSKSLDKCLANIGGLNSFIKPKMRVMLKCSLQNRNVPNDAMTTHPALVIVLAEKIAKLGASCVIVDSAESVKTNAIDKIYEESEMLAVSNEGCAELNNNFEVFKKDFEGVMTKSVTLLDCINECDVIINLPKMIADENGLKGGLDNLFGLIPSEMKAIVKNRLFTADDYNNYLLDVYECVKEKLVLTIVDGVVAHEVNSQRIMNFLMAGANVFAVDYCCYQLANLDPKTASLFNCSEKRNIFSLSDNVNVVGDNLDKFKKQDFASPLREYKKYSARQRKAKYNSYQKRTIIDPDRCKGCKRCIWACPVNAISEERDKNNEIYAKIDYDKCINCLRCVKACPYSVVETKIPAKYKSLEKKLEKRTKIEEA